MTGSKDKAFPNSDIDYVRNRSNTEIIIIDEADHSLETKISTAINLEIMRQMVELYEDFVSYLPKR